MSEGLGLNKEHPVFNKYSMFLFKGGAVKAYSESPAEKEEKKKRLGT